MTSSSSTPTWRPPGSLVLTLWHRCGCFFESVMVDPNASVGQIMYQIGGDICLRHELWIKWDDVEVRLDRKTLIMPLCEQIADFQDEAKLILKKKSFKAYKEEKIRNRGQIRRWDLEELSREFEVERELHQAERVQEWLIKCQQPLSEDLLRVVEYAEECLAQGLGTVRLCGDILQIARRALQQTLAGEMIWHEPSCDSNRVDEFVKTEHSQRNSAKFSTFAPSVEENTGQLNNFYLRQENRSEHIYAEVYSPETSPRIKKDDFHCVKSLNTNMSHISSKILPHQEYRNMDIYSNGNKAVQSSRSIILETSDEENRHNLDSLLRNMGILRSKILHQHEDIYVESYSQVGSSIGSIKSNPSNSDYLCLDVSQRDMHNFSSKALPQQEKSSLLRYYETIGEPIEKKSQSNLFSRDIAASRTAILPYLEDQNALSYSKDGRSNEKSPEQNHGDLHCFDISARDMAVLKPKILSCLEDKNVLSYLQEHNRIDRVRSIMPQTLKESDLRCEDSLQRNMANQSSKMNPIETKRDSRRVLQQTPVGESVWAKTSDDWDIKEKSQAIILDKSHEDYLRSLSSLQRDMNKLSSELLLHQEDSNTLRHSIVGMSMGKRSRSIASEIVEEGHLHCENSLQMNMANQTQDILLNKTKRNEKKVLRESRKSEVARVKSSDVFCELDGSIQTENIQKPERNTSSWANFSRLSPILEEETPDETEQIRIFSEDEDKNMTAEKIPGPIKSQTAEENGFSCIGQFQKKVALLGVKLFFTRAESMERCPLGEGLYANRGNTEAEKERTESSPEDQQSEMFCSGSQENNAPTDRSSKFSLICKTLRTYFP